MNNEQTGDLTIRDMARLLSRRRTTILVMSIGIFSLSVILAVTSTRRYEAESVFQLQKSNTDSLNLESMMGEASGGATDALTANIDLQTQANILQTDGLALRVIEQLNLEQNADYLPRLRPLSAVLGLISPKGKPDVPGAKLEDSPVRRERVLGVFHRNLRVRIASGTRLITVTYSNPDPKVAAAVANALVAALTEYGFQTKFNATNQASQWLEDQLSDLRKQSTDLQSKVVDLQKSTGLFGLGASDQQGKPIVYSPALDRFEQTNSALSQVETSQLLKGAIAQVAKTGNADLISQLSGTTVAASASQGVANSLSLIENLRGQESTLQQQIARDSSVFGPAYPHLIEEKAALSKVQTSLADEIHRIAVRAQNDYDIAAKATSGVRARYEQDKIVAQKLNDRTIEYTVLAKEAEESQQLYHDLLKRLREAGILEGLRSSNIAVVSIARPPSKPAKPNVRLYLGVGLLCGVIVGLGSAFLVDAYDNKVQGPDEIEAKGMALLGVLPAYKTQSAGITFVSDSTSTYSEAIRELRSNLFISKSSSPPQVIMVTSGTQGEGKSTIALNLAVAIAQLGKKVLIVELDLRRPVLKWRLNLPDIKGGGLATYLSDAGRAVEYSQVEGQPYLQALACGPVPPFPAELIQSPRMDQLLERWRKEFDFVVLDSPPLLPVSDVHGLLKKVDATILVVRANKSSRTSLSRLNKLLVAYQGVSGTITSGVVLNAVSIRSAAYYGYYGYYGDKKYHPYSEGQGGDNAKS